MWKYASLDCQKGRKLCIDEVACLDTGDGFVDIGGVKLEVRKKS